MKSMYLTDFGGKPILIEQDVPLPQPGPNEVLIRVHASGITPTELAWYPTSHTKNGESRRRAVPSHEFSGEVAGIGDGVAELSIGQEIYGMNDWFADGALAEYCLTQPSWIAPKPQSLSHQEAAAVPIGALTAWQGLFERAKLQAGERVLIHGGAGAVGVFVIQLAKSCGAHVITTVSDGNVEFVKKLGADEALDYRAGPFEGKVRDIDVVFDGVGGNTLDRSWGVLKESGRLVTIAAESGANSDQQIKKSFFIVEPHQKQLVEIGKRIDAGKLRPVLDTVLPWSKAADAYTGKVNRKGHGKLVVTVTEPKRTHSSVQQASFENEEQ